MVNRRAVVLFAAGALFGLPLLAADFYVSPAGSATGNGSKANPWSLSRALAPPPSVKPGDTIWLRGGTYTGLYVSRLRGQPNKPIVVRQYPGERATIDGNGNGNSPTVDFRGSYTWFWGFEITNSDATRSSTGPPSRGAAIHLLSPGSKLIDLVVHDTGQGVLTTASAPDIEIYGCLFYYNGVDAPDRGHGHGIYVQNETGIKRIVDNVIFDQFGIGIHAYTESGKLDNLYFEGNTSFNNGMLSQVSGKTTNFLIGANGAPATDPEASGKVAKKTSVINNYSYFSGAGGTAANLGYSKGIASPTILDNYLVGGRALALINAFRPISMSGNTLYGGFSGFQASEFPSNTYLSSRPTGVKVFVRPNHYEPGRANITIYNWDSAASVGVSLKSILNPGAQYEIRNAQNFFGPTVLSGTYDGTSTLQLPMNGLVPATPVGRPAPGPTGPEFQVFVVVPKPAGSNAKSPVASFSIHPRSPLAGQSVAFTDLSAGTVEGWSWDFGDPESGAQNTSILAQPTHVYSSAGTYTVRLTVPNEGGASMRTRDLTATASSGTRAATLPVAGHVLGANGTTFLTDVVVANPTSAPVSARLVFSPSGGGPSLESTLSLGPGETRIFPDVVASEFGVSGLGSLRAETDGAPAALRLAGRTYVEEGGATLGLGTVGLSAADTATGDRWLSNIAISDASRTNVGALNPSDQAQVFGLQLLDGHGNLLGRAFLSLAAGGQRQWALSELFPGVTGTGLTARIVPAPGALAPMAYAATTDNASSDPTYYTALGPAPVQYLPAIAGISGVGGAFFRSEVSIANSGRGAATVTVTFLEHDRNNTTAPTATFVLAPYETLHADDALQTLFGVTETYGALKIESDTSPGVTVFERILTDSSTTPGTVGQQVNALAAEDLLSQGAILGIRHDDAFRSNVGLVNPSPENVAVSLTLVRSPASPLGSATVVLPPRGYTQRSLASLFPTAALPGGEVLSIAVDGGGQPVLAFASVIDNVSQDPTFYPLQP